MSRRVLSSKWPLTPLALAAGAFLALAAPAAAQEQEPVTPPFVAGQKALHVAVGESFGIGGLFFRSPTSAWLVEAATSFRTQTLDLDTPLEDDEADNTSFDLQLRAGLRSLRALGGNTLAHHTVGLDGGFTTGSTEQGDVESEQRGWNAGAFWDVGGEYLFSERFGLGIRVGARIAYSRSTSEIGDSEATSSGFSIGTTPARLTGTLYF